MWKFSNVQVGSMVFNLKAFQYFDAKYIKKGYLWNVQ